MRTNEGLQGMRDRDLAGICTVGEMLDKLAEVCEEAGIMDLEFGSAFTVGEMLDALQADAVMAVAKDITIGRRMTVGALIDRIAANPDVQARRDEGIKVNLTVGDLIDAVGEDTLRELVQKKVAEVSRVDAYEKTRENILFYWGRFGLFILVFSFLAVVMLEFIDKDKR